MPPGSRSRDSGRRNPIPARTTGSHRIRPPEPCGPPSRMPHSPARGAQATPNHPRPDELKPPPWHDGYSAGVDQHGAKSRFSRLVILLLMIAVTAGAVIGAGDLQSSAADSAAIATGPALKISHGPPSSRTIRAGRNVAITIWLDEPEPGAVRTGENMRANQRPATQTAASQSQLHPLSIHRIQKVPAG